MVIPFVCMHLYGAERAATKYVKERFDCHYLGRMPLKSFRGDSVVAIISVLN